VSRSLAARCRPIAAAVAVIALVSTPAVTRAHAELVSATPAANASVVEAPAALTLTFSETIDQRSASIDVLDPQGRRVAGLGAAAVSPDGRTASVALPDLDAGVYTVSYAVVSTVDGHATTGIFAFLVDPTGAAPPPADSASASSPSVDLATVAARLVALASVLVALGGMVLWATGGRTALRESSLDARPPWSLTGSAALTAAGGVAAYLALAARPIPEGLGTGLPLDIAGAFGWTPFAIAMRVAFLAAVAAGLASLVLGRRGDEPWRPLLVGGLLLLTAAAMSLAGHAASIGGPARAALDALHVVAAAAWLGGLPAAFVLAWRAPADRGRLLRTTLLRHGRVAMIAAPVVVLTGVANSPIVLGNGRDLVASEYGNLLVAKAILVAAALGIGAVNHLGLRGRGRAALGALVTAELIVAALAVSAAATMVTIQPSSARSPTVAAPPIRPAHYFAELGRTRIHLAVSLPAPGTQAYRVTVRDTDTGAPRPDVQKVFLAFTPPAGGGLPDERVELTPDAEGGLWTASGAYTPIVGDWTLTVTVREAGERDASIQFGMRVLERGAAELAPAVDTGVGVPWPLGALWLLLPAGLAGWLPAGIALGLLAGLWPWRRRAAVAATRGAAVTILLVAGAAAASRTLVDIGSEPTAAALASQTPIGPDVDLDVGRAVYLANCASCHGRDGSGYGIVAALPRPGPLADVLGDASDAELSYRIANGVAGTAMPPFAGLLTAEERADLIGFLRDQFGDR
jgi:copper transport protein